jgi:hypothetical protein
MRVRLKFHDSVRPALAEWYRTLGTTERERRDWLELLLRVFTARLEEHGGVPPEAVREDTRTGPVYTVECGLVMFQYQVRPDPAPSGWWESLRRRLRRHRPARTAVVIGLVGRRPPA